jgi:cell division protein FtsI (penicillin-binding protein 3)
VIRRAAFPRLNLVIAASSLPLFLVWARVAWLQVVEGDELNRRAESQHVRRVWQPPVRGTVTDRNGEPLAYTMNNYSIVAEPSKVTNPRKTAAALAKALHTPPHRIERLLRSKRQQVYLERRVTPMLERRVDLSALSGIAERLELKRVYPLGESAAHVVGYLDHGAQGSGGIESELEELLRGEPGWATELRDARGNAYFALGKRSKPARRGHDVTLTLDAKLQDVAASELRKAAERLDARGGALVAVDPRTGEILALVSWPSFDPERIGETPLDALRNRAVVDPYEPGSTFKLVAATCALQDGILAPGTPIHCEEGTYDFGGYTITDHHPYGTLTFKEAFAKSSNIAFGKVGVQCGERLYPVARAFGFGSPTGIPLAGESGGMIRPPRDWSRRSAATLAIGYEVMATPVQLAMAYAAVANEGVRMRPSLIRTITDPDGKVVYRNRPEALERVMKPELARTLLSFMRGVMTSGTGMESNLAWVAVGGKTGTSEKFQAGSGYSRSRHFASFVGIAPLDDPKLVCLVVLDEPKVMTYGGSAAAPVFSNVLEAFGRLPGAWLRPEYAQVQVEEPPAQPLERFVPPALAAGGASDPGTLSPPRGLPDVRGESMRQALQVLRAYGVTAEVHGTGVVERQSPAPGSPITEPVHLFGSRGHRRTMVMASAGNVFRKEGRGTRSAGSPGSR